jgi:AraC-like DNA-binding protein
MKACSYHSLHFRSRCEKARWLLQRTKMPNRQIAKECNLTDAAVSSMNRKYKIREVRQYQRILS